jgi:flavin-dependent dehydrogenase
MSVDLETEILVVGAGPAGLATAIELSRHGRQVLLVERGVSSSRRRLCGEFLSGDGCRVLVDLGGALREDCPEIDHLLISSHRGGCWSASVPRLGRGCTRSQLTEHLRSLADASGVRYLQGIRVAVDPSSPVRARRGTHHLQIRSDLTIYASGQTGAARAQRMRGGKKRGWLAVAVHAEGDLPRQVQLHTTSRGYIGVNPVEGGRVNLCGLWRTPCSATAPLQILSEEAVSNPLLHNALASMQIIPQSLATASGLDFGSRDKRTSVLTVGDVAAAPVPMLGQGLAAALRSGQMLGRLVNEELHLPQSARGRLHGRYRRAWQAEFGRRFALGRLLQQVMLQPFMAQCMLQLMGRLPAVGHFLVQATRGSLQLDTSRTESIEAGFTRLEVSPGSSPK